MKRLDVTVHIFIKKAVVNPEEGPVRRRLHDLGFATVSNVSMGKCFVVSLEAPHSQDAERLAREMCDKLLINPVTEHYLIDKVEEVGLAVAA